MNHTPTPWRAEENRILYLWRGKWPRVATIKGHNHTDEANAWNAAYIAKCVNAHDELVAALEESFVYFAAQSWEEKAAFVERARAILAKVKA